MMVTKISPSTQILQSQRWDTALPVCNVHVYRSMSEQIGSSISLTEYVLDTYIAVSRPATIL